jgi:hypothetical protein
MSLHTQKDHYAALEDVHVNLENRNHAFEEYGYGPLNPKEPSEDFWNEKAKVFNTTVEEAKKSRCGNCAAFNQSKEIMKRIADGLGPVGDVVAEKADLGFCEMFKFKCAAERTCDAWLVNGPITEEMSTAGVVGTGDDPTVWKPSRPLARRGRFMNLETFIVSSSTFNSLRDAKKYKKQWRTYLEEDDAYHDLREYARKHDGPIVVEDERTGACMFVRYGKGKLNEAWTNTITRSNKLGGAVGDTVGPNIARALHGEVKDKYRGHDVHVRNFSADWGGPRGKTISVRNPETGKIVAQAALTKVSGKAGSGHKVAAASAEGVPGGMHGLYHHLLKRGHVTSLVGDNQSEGAQKVWSKLSRKSGVTVAGWSKGKPVNLGKHLDDREETHADPDTATEPEEKEIGNMKLVASYEAPKKKMLSARRKR